MFGIGLPEIIVILAVALIVVGPDKLPGLARSLAKGLMEMKKTLNQVKESLTEEDETLKTVQRDLRTTADDLRTRLIDTDLSEWKPAAGPDARSGRDQEPVIDVEPEERAIEAELRHQDAPADETAAPDRQAAQAPPPETAATFRKSAGDSTQAP
ncbi:twin-arginine translocase TatA/TatE family subunit [Desulfobulbus elongatus]|uniref:twin-arginine translocase TatA/TatE family subunit n=1 Tax=Desulfobulbus elongatus TaxID=53332 RepID=UPI00054F7615|nr:twin-arginine translocase TatA/TatE family subunit [Desulfobulbus elongatus]